MAPMQQRMLDILAEALNFWDAQIPAGSWLVFFFVLVLKPTQALIVMIFN
jgi:hypothetical protein